MELYNKIFKQKRILYSFITLCIFFILFSIYALGKPNIDYLTIYNACFSSYCLLLVIIPFLLYINSCVFKLMYKYKVILRYSHIYKWWNRVKESSALICALYTIVTNIIIIPISFIRAESKNQVAIDTLVFFLICIISQFMFYLTVSRIYNIISYLLGNMFLSFVSTISILLLYNQLCSLFHLNAFKIDTYISIPLRNNYIEYYPNILCILGTFLLIKTIDLLATYMLETKEIY